MDKVYIIFEKVLRSCNTEYEYDGFIIMWDSEEIGRNLTTFELIEQVKCCDYTYGEIIKFLKIDIDLEYNKENCEKLNEKYFDLVVEQLEVITANCLEKHDYKEISLVNKVCSTEKIAKEKCEYYKNNIAYKNNFYYVEYRCE